MALLEAIALENVPCTVLVRVKVFAPDPTPVLFRVNVNLVTVEWHVLNDSVTKAVRVMEFVSKMSVCVVLHFQEVAVRRTPLALITAFSRMVFALALLDLVVNSVSKLYRAAVLARMVEFVSPVPKQLMAMSLVSVNVCSVGREVLANKSHVHQIAMAMASVTLTLDNVLAIPASPTMIVH